MDEVKVNHRKEKLKGMSLERLAELGKVLTVPHRYYTDEQKVMLADLEAEVKSRKVA
jgi:hypothetical protein